MFALDREQGKGRTSTKERVRCLSLSLLLLLLLPAMLSLTYVSLASPTLHGNALYRVRNGGDPEQITQLKATRTWSKRVGEGERERERGEKDGPSALASPRNRRKGGGTRTM